MLQNITCIINGEEKIINQEEFEFIIQVFGEPTEEISNCCSAPVYEHNANDHTSRCTQCEEGCEIIYIWG